MKQENETHFGKGFTPADVQAENSAVRAVHKPLAKEAASIQPGNGFKKAEEMLAPYYDEFHFANYE